MVYDRCCYFLQCVLDQKKKNELRKRGKASEKEKTRKKTAKVTKHGACVCVCVCMCLGFL